MIEFELEDPCQPEGGKYRYHVSFFPNGVTYRTDSWLLARIYVSWHCFRRGRIIRLHDTLTNQTKSWET